MRKCDQGWEELTVVNGTVVNLTVVNVKVTSSHAAAFGPSSRKAARGGFTLLEMLVVVGILLVLIAIAVVGFKLVGDRTKINATRVTLENLRTMYLEAESRGVTKRQPDSLWIGSSTGTARSKSVSTTTPDTGTNRTPDLWRLPNPASDPSVTAIVGASPPLIVAFAPGAVSDETKGDNRSWLTDPMVRNTAIAMTLMRGVPTVAKSLDALGNGVNKTADFYRPSSAYAKDSRALANDLVGADQGLKLFVASRDITPNSGQPTVGGNWTEDVGAVLDPFGNPILFVPAAGLQVGAKIAAGQTGTYKVGYRVYVEGGGSADRAYWICIQATNTGPSYGGSATPTWKRADPIRAPDGKPFWVSAGPDGNFDTNEDNVYSFEN